MAPERLEGRELSLWVAACRQKREAVTREEEAHRACEQAQAAWAAALEQRDLLTIAHTTIANQLVMSHGLRPGSQDDITEDGTIVREAVPLPSFEEAPAQPEAPAERLTRQQRRARERAHLTSVVEPTTVERNGAVPA